MTEFIDPDAAPERVKSPVPTLRTGSSKITLNVTEVLAVVAVGGNCRVIEVTSGAVPSATIVLLVAVVSEPVTSMSKVSSVSNCRSVHENVPPDKLLVKSASNTELNAPVPVEPLATVTAEVSPKS